MQFLAKFWPFTDFSTSPCLLYPPFQLGGENNVLIDYALIMFYNNSVIVIFQPSARTMQNVTSQIPTKNVHMDIAPANLVTILTSLERV